MNTKQENHALKELTNTPNISNISNTINPINTSWDDYYLNPYRFTKSELVEEIITVSSPNSISLVDLINNLTNKAINNEKKSNLNSKSNSSSFNTNTNLNSTSTDKTKLTTNYILTNNFEQNEKKFNPILFKLIANDNISQLEYLLKNKINSLNINEQDKDGDTPLHISVFLSNTNAIKLLIDYGADIYILDKWGQTSLHRICFSIGEAKSTDILNIFIKNNHKKKNIFNIQDNYGNTPCHLVLKHIIKNKIILNKTNKLLIKKIISKTSKKIANNDGFTIDDLVKKIY